MNIKVHPLQKQGHHFVALKLWKYNTQSGPAGWVYSVTLKVNRVGESKVWHSKWTGWVSLQCDTQSEPGGWVYSVTLQVNRVGESKV